MSIQIDDGEWTRLHNTILEKLAIARFTASEYRCLMYLFRATYGWQKKEDAISLSQWATGTGIDPKKRQNVLRTLQGLIDKRVIYAKPNGNNRPMTWGFNKNFEHWEASLFEATVIGGDNSLGDESVIPADNSRGATVIPPDNTSVITGDNTTVISSENRTVITGDNNKRKKENTKKAKENTATQPALAQERVLTPQQEMYAAICEAIGWDYKTITEADKVRVAQTVKILGSAQYDVSDIRRFMVEVWFRDWRWEKHQQYPTLSQLRQEIGKLRAGIPEQVPRPPPNGRVAASLAAIDEYDRIKSKHGVTT